MPAGPQALSRGFRGVIKPAAAPQLHVALPILFDRRHSTQRTLWGPIVGPLVAVISFVCSVGNIPLAAVLWNGGISFGGVIAFIFADLIVELVFDGFALIPSEHKARVVEASITWNYATWLDLGFLVLAAFLVWRFLKTGGPAMLRMMNRPADR